MNTTEIARTSASWRTTKAMPSAMAKPSAVPSMRWRVFCHVRCLPGWITIMSVSRSHAPPCCSCIATTTAVVTPMTTARVTAKAMAIRSVSTGRLGRGILRPRKPPAVAPQSPPARARRPTTAALARTPSWASITGGWARTKQTEMGAMTMTDVRPRRAVSP